MNDFDFMLRVLEYKTKTRHSMYMTIYAAIWILIIGVILILSWIYL